jgi:thiamine pyrophosphate-dependent acetolactate synthase large subunit-like protein
MEGLEKFNGLFQKPIEQNLNPTFRLNGDIELALFAYLQKCQQNQKQHQKQMSKLNKYEKRKLKRIEKKKDSKGI